jgi:hypothetical protein
MKRRLAALEDLLEDISVEPMLDPGDGKAVPRLHVSGTGRLAANEMGAAVFAVAALVEAATPDAGTWRVRTDHAWGSEGWVILDLRDADPLEAALAMAVLEQVAQHIR